MTPYIIKLIAELIVLFVLWSIARKQEELEKNQKPDMYGRIKGMPCDICGGTEYPHGHSKDPSFKDKKTAEEKRIKRFSTNTYTGETREILPAYNSVHDIKQSSKVAKKKVTKK